MSSTGPNRRTAWQIRVPLGSGFAELLVLHDQDAVGEALCGQCGWHAPPSPLRVEWDEGSDVIGDFVSARAHIGARESVLNEVSDSCRGVAKGKIEMPDHPNLRRPRNSEEMKRVWLPYEGPPLAELVTTHEVDLLPASTLRVERNCSACGRIVYKAIEGIERRSSRGRTPREPGKGLFFSGETLDGAVIFRPRFTGLTLCTPEARQVIEGRGYSNIEFLEAGDILNDA